MLRLCLICTGLMWALLTGAASAQQSTEKILGLDGHITADGTAIELNWFDAQPPRVGSVTVKRRLYGQRGGQSWQVLATDLGPVMRYRDETIRPGSAYEYQVLRSARDIIDVGYWLGGTEIPAQGPRGHAYVIVDETVNSTLAARLDRFTRDLMGDGWQVHRHTVPRHDGRQPAKALQDAVMLRTWLQARYSEDPFGQHAIILVGHVPIVQSGSPQPDGHGRRPHPTDLFYADMDGRWSTLSGGTVLDSRIPGDFIEMQVGRIDFAPVSGGVVGTEIHHLRAYFDKNHHWRMGYHGDLRMAYGATGHLAVERAALRNIVGATQLVQGGHHDIGEEQPWLWGVDFGDLNGARYAELHANKAIFTLNFGSHKQMFHAHFNAMTALLAQPWYPVTVGWGARPAWWLHHMALGASIGTVHMRTVNNGRAGQPYRETMDYFPTGGYLIRNGIWVNLLGDPTLRAFPLAPPRQVQTATTAQGVTLSWQPSSDPDARGYRVFRSEPDQPSFTLLGNTNSVQDVRFVDPDPVEGARYMVRAVGLKDVYAGSFHTLSQGAFSAESPLRETDIDFQIKTGQATALPAQFSQDTEKLLYALIAGPARGQLRWNGTTWLYTPPTGFTGALTVPISVSDTWRSGQAMLRITVTK